MICREINRLIHPTNVLDPSAVCPTQGNCKWNTTGASYGGGGRAPCLLEKQEGFWGSCFFLDMGNIKNKRHRKV
jgi:hypothetical protein